MDNNMRFWNRTAGLYTFLQERSNKELYRKTAMCCRRYISKDMRVLELACGTGQFTYELWDCAASWTAADFSEAMIMQAAKRGPTGAVFAQADATELPYGDGAFDCVLIANALHIMPEPEKALGEIHRVLRHGGVLLAPTFIYEGRINRFRLKIAELAGFKTFRKWTLRELSAFIEEAGFRIEESCAIQGSLLPEGFAAALKTEE